MEVILLFLKNGLSLLSHEQKREMEMEMEMERKRRKRKKLCEMAQREGVFPSLPPSLPLFFLPLLRFLSFFFLFPLVRFGCCLPRADKRTSSLRSVACLLAHTGSVYHGTQLPIAETHAWSSSADLQAKTVSVGCACSPDCAPC